VPQRKLFLYALKLALWIPKILIKLRKSLSMMITMKDQERRENKILPKNLPMPEIIIERRISRKIQESNKNDQP